MRQMQKPRTNLVAAGSEIELKLLFAESELPKVTALVATDARHVEHQFIRTVYFDTQKHDLWKRGFTLRVRAAGNGYEQGIKRIQSSSIARTECEEEVAGPGPDLRRLKASPLARFASQSNDSRRLHPVFETGTDRTTFALGSETRLIEASIDRGQIRAGAAKLGICELELELKHGAASDLFNLASRFVSQALLRPNTISKAERGYLLADGAWGRAAKGTRPRLDAKMPIWQAFQEIARACLHDFHLNVPLMEHFGEIEGIHQGRIAIRRLRAAMTLFKPMVSDASFRQLTNELKWLGGLLGTARNLDVLLTGFRRHAAGSEGDSRVSEISPRAEARRLQARRAVVESLDSERGRALVVDLIAWIENGRWLRQFARAAGQTISGFARSKLTKRLSRLVKRGKNLADLDAGARHKVRIEAKKLRYMAEFFAATRGVAKHPKQYHSLIACCEKLQESLGAIRDQDAMDEFLQREISSDAGLEASPDAACAHPFQEHRPGQQKTTGKELRRAVKACSKLAAVNPF
jgi:triphosphatase